MDGAKDRLSVVGELAEEFADRPGGLAVEARGRLIYVAELVCAGY
jgi:hypothetical protein